MMIEFFDGFSNIVFALARKDIELVGVTRNTDALVSDDGSAICKCRLDVNVVGIVL